MFCIGPLRQRLYLQQESLGADTGGGGALSWTTIATLWAAVEPFSGKEALQAGRISGSITHRIRLRYDSSVTTAMRFLWGSRVFNIRDIRNINERNRVMEILAEEGVAT